MRKKSIVVVGMGPGIGMAAARRFAAEGFQVGMIGRNPERIAAFVKTLELEGITAFGRAADAGDPSMLSEAIADLARSMGRIDVLLYNAFALHMASPSVLTPEELAADLSVNVGGALVAAQAALPGMRQRGHGAMLFTGGGFALQPMPALCSLGIGKAALRNFVASLHGELAPMGIRAATVTVCGTVTDEGKFAASKIADALFEAQAAPSDAPFEILFTGENR